MLVEANRICSAWFSDANATSGVNALLALVSLDGSDTRPDPLATITNEVDDKAVARDEPPAVLPGLAVSVDVVTDQEGHVQVVTADGKVNLRFRVTVDNVDTAKAKRDLSYYLVALTKSFRTLMQDAHQAARTRNGYYLETCEVIKTAIVAPNPTNEQAATSVRSGYLLATVVVRQLSPFA